MLGSVKEFNYAEFIKRLEFFSKDDPGLSVENVARVGMEDLNAKYGIALRNVNSISALTVASSLVIKSKRIQG